ncbi:DUF2752 domain-containing protein [Ferruginibacter sp. SUN002]|uniref:DUF2752 domain-containing protein n=1 Tax=Ferruginibacter sp. SUN002 TaxID=2937789 RepID=UPI003D368494
MNNNRIYFLFNCIWAGIIILLLFYAGFFAYSNHAVNCVYRQATGLDCPTCGLTRSFHHLLIGNIKEATQLNGLSLQLFAFFVLQLIGRLVLIILFIRQKKYPTYCNTLDIISSIIVFVICFFPLITDIFK